MSQFIEKSARVMVLLSVLWAVGTAVMLASPAYNLQVAQAAKSSNPCNPCAAKPANPCNPCSPGAKKK